MSTDLRAALVELHAAAVEMFDGITSHGQAIRRAEAALNGAEGGTAQPSLDPSHAFDNCIMCGAAVDDPEAREPCEPRDNAASERPEATSDDD